jgi:predicted site-specific integrase-resolvase
MEIRHLNQKQLAERWQVSEASLERWRSEKLGPDYLKLHGRVIYRQQDIEAFESCCLKSMRPQADSASP